MRDLEGNLSKRRFGLLLVSALVGGAMQLSAAAAQSQPGSAQVLYGSAPTWLSPTPSATATATPAGAPYRVVYSDMQTRASADHVERYAAYRVKILTPQALNAGQLQLEWNPDSQSVTVNAVRIYRDAKPADVLASTHFTVLQREENLEASALTGVLTAAMQIPGLQVGDEVEFAFTIRERDTVFGGHAYGAQLMSSAEGPGANRAELSWNPERKLKYQASSDIPKAQVTPGAVTWTFNDPGEVQAADGAPGRFNVRRLIEYSDFTDWKQVSAAVFALFSKAESLQPSSPVSAEAARIGALTSDPILRAQAALKFAQEDIRYVFVGLNGANYRPMDVDKTWNNRFGDCKAKAVMLDAMLRQLGISSEIILVNSTIDDTVSSRLPSPLAFDHAIVRVTINGRKYYLDPTQYGNRVLSSLEWTRYTAVLALSDGGSDLELIAAKPPKRPTLIVTTDEDWSAGVDKPAKMTTNRYIFGDTGAMLNAQLAAMSPEQADRGLRAYWAQTGDSPNPDSVSWRYDYDRSVIVLTMATTTSGDWSDDPKTGRSLGIARSGSYPPPKRKRPSNQDQGAPWANEFPSYECAITNVHLPRSSGKLGWDYSADPFDVHIGGIRYVRSSAMAGGVVRTVRIHETLLPEIDAAAAAQANAEIASFDNSIGQIYQDSVAASGAKDPKPNPQSAPLIGDVNWTDEKTVCSLE
jgi:transglutaminase-like putative cysteine protease